MKQLKFLFTDLVLGFIEGIQRLSNLFNRTKAQPSIVALNINWCTQSGWMDRLIAYKQLDLWTHNK